MNYQAKGIVLSIAEATETKMGMPLQQINFEQEGGGIIYPSAIGRIKMALLDDLQPGDVADLTFVIRRQQAATHDQECAEGREGAGYLD